MRRVATRVVERGRPPSADGWSHHPNRDSKFGNRAVAKRLTEAFALVDRRLIDHFVVRAHPRRTSQYQAIHTGTLSTTA